MQNSQSKLLAVFLSITLCLWSVPFAFADKPEVLTDVVKPSSNEPLEPEEKDETPSEEITPIVPDTSEGGVEENSDQNDALELKAEEDMLGMTRSVIGGDSMYQVDLEQQKGSTVSKVSLPNAGVLLDSGRADRVVIEASMNYGGVITRSVAVDKTLSTIVQEGGFFEFDFTTYGKFSVSVKFYKGSDFVKAGDTMTMGITADEYNIAPVSASLPVAFFSLSLWGEGSIRYDANGNVIPTIMLMERPNAWNWDNLPEGVYPLPYLSKEEVAYQPPDFTAASNQFRAHSAALNAYVADLYEMSPHATFNLYLVDYYLGLIQSVIYANKIPQSQYTITVLSDGSFSYSRFSGVYGGSAPQNTHAALIDEWNAAKAEAYSTGKVRAGYSLGDPNGSLYAAVDSEPNAQWWLARPALLESKGDGGAFGKNIAQKDPQVISVNIAQKLKGLQAEGEVAINEFKSLYNFSDAYFSEAEAAGKDVMLFLGTTVGSEAGSFSDYARFAMAYYGDKYAYYYKGHPGSPTDFYPEKQAELEALGITDIDSSIAAELILFFYPDISLSGYPSSTYASLTDPDMAKGMFRITKAEALTNASYVIMDWFISPVSDKTDAAIRTLCKQGDSNFLVEFSDAQLGVLDYTIAIWNSTTSTVSYYRLVNGNYEFVRSTQAGGSLIDGGVYTIGSKAAQGRMLDIAGASVDNGANVQIYDSNESFAQRFRLSHVGGGYYTIQNAKSGKMLDVSNASQAPGTNVHQWDSNGTDAQKWKLVETGDGDGSYYLISKCNGLYLDQQWGQTSNGANVWVYTGNGSTAQKFYLNKITPTVEDGSYVLKSSLSDSMVLDVAGGSVSNEANVQLYQENGTKAQLFELTYNSSTGYYIINNANSNKVIDVQWGGASSGTNVWQYQANGSYAQSWSIKKGEGDSFILYSSTGQGCCLDVSGGIMKDGANIQIWSPNGTAAQAWKLDKVA